MDYIAYLRFVLAFALVLGLIFLCAYIARRLGYGGKLGGPRHRRLQVVETGSIDNKSRLVLVRRDNVEHLLAISQSTMVVIESNIVPTPAADSKPIKTLAKPRRGRIKKQ
ncbi:MAG: flagellar biosynthetic protein FliO [Candidatus Pacebacteria bacterium]|nr:flagellar biosynthetic protein FliO [Candidatus Paceibacterota bacterium]